ncbi:MAG: hypothetical protein WBP81_27010, partial [Solirubrobacteraceae bacterium]
MTGRGGLHALLWASVVASTASSTALAMALDQSTTARHGLIPADLDRRLHEQELGWRSTAPDTAACSRRSRGGCVGMARVSISANGSRGWSGSCPARSRLGSRPPRYNLLSGRRDGRDVWGEVRCNLTLRDGVLGLLAIAGGLWVKHSKPGEQHVDLTAGEAAYLLRAKRRASKRSSGRDIAWVYEQLAQLAALELRADGGGEGHEIPCSPVKRVLRKLDGEWVTLEQYAERIEQGARPPTGAGDTIRIELADWFIDELRHRKRRPVLIDFCVWRQLRPLARRVYAMLQGTGRSSHDPDRLYIWFAPVARDDGKQAGASRAFTLGLTTARIDKVAARIRTAIAELREVDERYDGYGKQTTHGNTRYPAFTIRVTAGRASRPRHPERVGRAFDWTAS